MSATKRTIEVDDATATALESRAAATGVSVADLLAEIFAGQGAPFEAAAAELAALDRQWAAIQSDQPTVPHEHVARWLDTWGSSDFRRWQDR
jgi:hypothetical protein